MMRLILFFSLSLACHSLFAQVDHWESVILEGDTWSYLVPAAELPADWTSLDFDDSGWATGPSGFGYGDGDDATDLGQITSVYIRKSFDITDLTSIEDAILSIDYDDGFVAYLNGTEIARANMDGSPPSFDQFTTGLREATLYQGGAAESFVISEPFVQGTNILAVQVHNQSSTSSDLSAIPILSVGLNTPDQQYQDTPSWFQPPLEFTSSHLPIVVINTNGASIPDEPKIPADFGIIFTEGQESTSNDPWNEYAGHIGIERRGYSSQSFAKKSYGIELWDANGQDIDSTFLNFPSEEDFVLHGPYSDKTLMNNALIMKLGNALGAYAPRTRFVELVLNNDYKGVYLLMEKIKRDADRLDIAKLNPEENSGDDVTGGYIFKVDRRDEPGWESEYNAYNGSDKIYFAYFYPKGSEITPQQENYLQNYVREFEMAMAGADGRNVLGKHFLNYMDLRSFVDNFLLNELSKNVDAYRLSSYFHKDKTSKGGKIHAGPFWDFNLAFGNGDYCGGDDTSGWEFYQCDHGGSPFWWDVLIQDPTFTDALRCRWEALRATTLHTDSVNAVIDGFVEELGEARNRNFQRWPTLGSYVWPNPWYFVQATSHDQIVVEMKNWIAQRSEWLDSNIPGVAVNCEDYEPPLYGKDVTSLETQLRLQVFPNPASTHLEIRADYPLDNIILTDGIGRAVRQITSHSHSVQVSLEGLPEGMYLLEIGSPAGKMVKKVVIRH